jgi:hypothetical protein
MIDIFISYARNDQKYVEWAKPVLKRLLLEEGITYFQDIENIRPGEDFKDSIDSAITNAAIIICFLSTHYFSSDFIQKHELPAIEVRFNRNVKILLVLVDQVYIRPDSIFHGLQRISFEGKTLQDFESILREEFKHFPRNGNNKVSARYNLVVLGKTGVGKSALVNYLFGEEVVRSGIGMPVTELGFQRNDLNFMGLPASIFDSAGLEVGHYERWKQKLDEELSVRGATQDVQKWFHTILYCVHAPGLRIEPYELGIIRQFLDNRYKVIVVITKSYISGKKIDELAKSIKDNISGSIRCVYVNSHDEEIGGGTTIKMFGKLQLINEIQISLVESLTDRIPARCIGFMSNYIDEKCNAQKRYVNDRISSIPRNSLADNVAMALEDISKQIHAPDGHFRRIISRETRNTLSVYKEIATFTQRLSILEDVDITITSSQRIDVPKIKSFGQRFEDSLKEAYDWDLTEKYGAVVNVVSKVVALPFFLFVDFLASIGDHIEDVVKWREKMMKEIDAFRDEGKKKLWKEEESIKKLYSDHFRNFNI